MSPDHYQRYRCWHGALTVCIVAVFAIASGAIVLIPTYIWSLRYTDHSDAAVYRLVWQRRNVAAYVAAWFAMAACVTGARPWLVKVSGTVFSFRRIAGLAADASRLPALIHPNGSANMRSANRQTRPGVRVNAISPGCIRQDYFPKYMITIRKILASRSFLWILIYLPFALLVHGFAMGEIYYGEMLHASGEFSARLLIVALAATPLRLTFPNRAWTRWLLANRRYFGVATFAYALLHTVVYLGKQESLSTIVAEALGFEMWTAWLALLIFAVLAFTSNDRSVRVLKTAWKRLHRWVYMAALLAFLHWIFIAFDFVPGLVHLLILLAIQGLRLTKSRRQRAA